MCADCKVSIVCKYLGFSFIVLIASVLGHCLSFKVPFQVGLSSLEYVYSFMIPIYDIRIPISYFLNYD